MGASAAVAAVVANPVAAIGTAVAAAPGALAFLGANQAAHAATNAHTAVAEEQMQTTDAIENAQAQDQKTQSNVAQQTAAAQARVRSLSNPEGNTMLTSPLPAVGTLATTGKTTVGS